MSGANTTAVITTAVLRLSAAGLLGPSPVPLLSVWPCSPSPSLSGSLQKLWHPQLQP